MDDHIITIYSIYHFLIYFIIALFYPNKWILILIISILWEILEIFLNFGNKNILFVGSDYWDEIPINKIVDIIFNLAGYGAGHLFLMYILKKNI